MTDPVGGNTPRNQRPIPLWASLLTLLFIVLAVFAAGWVVRGFFTSEKDPFEDIPVVEAPDKAMPTEPDSPAQQLPNTSVDADSGSSPVEQVKTLDQLVGDGRFALKAGDYAKAAEAFDKALALNPSHLDALYGKGMALLGSGQGAEGEKQLWAVLDRQPGYVEAGLALCERYAATGRYRSAVTTGRKVLESVPANADLEYWVGVGYEGLGQPAVAKEWYRAAIVDRPGHESATQALARLGG